MIADLHYSVTCREKVVEEFPTQCSNFSFVVKALATRAGIIRVSPPPPPLRLGIGPGVLASSLRWLAAPVRRQLMPVLRRSPGPEILCITLCAVQLSPEAVRMQFTLQRQRILTAYCSSMSCYKSLRRTASSIRAEGAWTFLTM